MTYNPNVPQPGDLLSVSQSDILTNFGQANTHFGYDHYEFNFAGGAAAPYDIAVAADKGKHRQVTLVRVSADIGNAGANELALYNINTAAGNQELFMRRESGGTIIRMTAGDPVAANSGFSFLPGGMLIQWGQVAAPGNSGAVVFPTAYLAATPPFSITLSLQRSSGNQSVTVDNGTPPTNTGFNYLSSSSGSNIVYWIAIGQAP